MADGENTKIYAKLDDHDRRITTLESTRPFLQDLIDRSIKSNEVLAQTMQDVQLSMVKMNDKMDEQAEGLRQMRADFVAANKTVTQKVEDVEKKVSNLDDEGKFNIRTYLKTNWPWVIVVLGMGIFIATKYVKF